MTHPNPVDKKKAVAWANSLIARQDWVIIDIESTGYEDNEQNEVLEIALVSPVGQVLYQSYVKPFKKQRWPAAQRIHKITPEFVANCRTLPEIWREMLPLINGKMLIAYNARYVENLISNSLDIAGDSNSAKDVPTMVSVMDHYAAYVGEVFRADDSQYKWQKLPNSNSTATGDAKAVYQLIQVMASDRHEEQMMGCMGCLYQVYIVFAILLLFAGPATLIFTIPGLLILFGIQIVWTLIIQNDKKAHIKQIGK